MAPSYKLLQFGMGFTYLDVGPNKIPSRGKFTDFYYSQFNYDRMKNAPKCLSHLPLQIFCSFCNARWFMRRVKSNFARNNRVYCARAFFNNTREHKHCSMFMHAHIHKHEQFTLNYVLYENPLFSDS